MNKKLLLFVFVLCSTVFAVNFVSAADAHVFTDVSDARLLAIDNSGNTNATGWLAENGIQLSDTYCALGGCTFTGVVLSDSNFTTSAFFVGDGTYLTNIPGSNASFNQALTDTLYAGIEWDYNQTTIANAYTDAQDTIFNDSMTVYVDAQDVIFNDSMTVYVDNEIAGVSGMDFTNLALINITNIFTPQQVFTGGLNSSEDINLASTKSVAWADGGSVSGTAGVITYKAGV